MTSPYRKQAVDTSVDFHDWQAYHRAHINKSSDELVTGVLLPGWILVNARVNKRSKKVVIYKSPKTFVTTVLTGDSSKMITACRNALVLEEVVLNKEREREFDVSKIDFE